jgi:acyl-CoA thioester hydrolase
MEAQDGIRLAVVDAHCRYLYPARYDDEIAVKTWVARANPRIVEFHYEICDSSTARELASGETRHIFLASDMKPVKLPAKYRPLFGVGISTG